MILAMDVFEQTELASSLIEEENYEKAIEVLNKVIEAEPDNDSVYIMRGTAYFSMHDTDKAQADFEHAIELDDESDQAYWYLSQLYQHYGDLAKAESFIEKAYNIDRENFVYVSDYATLMLNTRNFDKCMELCNEILDYYPAHVFALNMRGRCYMEQNNYAQAIRDLEKALFESRHDPIVLNNLGHAYIKTGNVQKAMKYLHAAVQTDPSIAFPYNNIGYAHYLEGNLPEAIEWIEKSMALDGKNPSPYKNRALVYIKMNETDKAREDLRKAKELGFAEKFGGEVDELLEQIG